MAIPLEMNCQMLMNLCKTQLIWSGLDKFLKTSKN